MTNQTDLRTALDGAATAVKRVMMALPTDFATSEKCPVDDLMSALDAIRMASAALTAPPRLDHAGGVREPDHEFKSHPDVFWPAVRGEKTFEFRKDDRGGYSVGQSVRLRCYDPDHGYHGHPPLDRRITNILRGGEFGLQEGYCVLSLAPLTPAHAPDKAVTREGLKTRMEAALDGKTRWSRDCHLSGEYLCSLVWPMVEDALAPKPTGAEARRGVDTEDDENPHLCLAQGIEDSLKVLGRVTLDSTDWAMVTQALRTATSTPPVSPTPDSAGPAGAIYEAVTQGFRNHDDVGNCGIDDPDNIYVRKLRDSIVATTLAALTPSAPIAAPVRDDGVRDDWREDPSADERWNAGLDYGMTQLCAVLKVDTNAVNWDAATETLDGDVRSVLRGILTIWGGDDWQGVTTIREMLSEGQGDDDGSQILPDFAEDASLASMVEACLHLLERRRDVIAGYSTKSAPVRDDGATVERMCRAFVGPAWGAGNFMGAGTYRDRMRDVLASLPTPASDVPGEAQTQEGGR